jgi:hypothetical protein
MDSSISRPRTLSAAGKLNVAGLVAAAWQRYRHRIRT